MEERGGEEVVLGMRRAGAKRQPCMLAACMRRPPAHVPPQLRATAPAQEVARATYAPSPPSKMPGTTHQAAGGGASMAGQRDGPRGEWGREKEKERVRARAGCVALSIVPTGEGTGCPRQ